MVALFPDYYTVSKLYQTVSIYASIWFVIAVGYEGLPRETFVAQDATGE